jgi:hypothetical protein
MDVLTLLVATQAFGAFFGTGCVIVSEVAFVRAMHDGVITSAERVHLAHLGRALRYGLALVLLSSFGLAIEAYLRASAVQPALTTSYWLLVALSLLIIYASWALSRGRISSALGSAVLFTGWWFLCYLVVGLFPSVSFGGAVALYVVATALFYGILAYARFLVIPARPGRIA